MHKATINSAVIQITSLLVLMSGLASLGKLIMEPEPEDNLPKYISRYSPFRPYLPKHAPVGYLSDSEVSKIAVVNGKETPLLNIASMRKFVFAQFCIAPTILVHDGNMQYVITDFAKSSLAVAEAKKFKIVHDFGSGAMLLEKR